MRVGWGGFGDVRSLFVPLHGKGALQSWWGGGGGSGGRAVQTGFVMCCCGQVWVRGGLVFLDTFTLVSLCRVSIFLPEGVGRGWFGGCVMGHGVLHVGFLSFVGLAGF